MSEPQLEPVVYVQAPLHKRLSALAASCAYIRKDGINQFHKYSYATAAQIFERVGEGLSIVGLVSVPEFTLIETSLRTNAKGGQETLATVQCRLSLFGEDDESRCVVTTAYGSGMDNGDKAIMKAQTAALKYAWMMLLNISTEIGRAHV